MKQLSYIKVFAPATVANVASGFDVLGFALEKPGDTVELTVKSGKKVQVTDITGDAGMLPFDPEKNTAAVAVESFLHSMDCPFGIDIKLHKQMPLSSGLGSSAASSVAAVYGVNILAGEPLRTTDLLPYTLQAEKAACGAAHGDNTAPSLLGGFVLIRSYNPPDVIKLPVPEGISCAVAHPNTEVNTGDARKILKKEVSLSKAISQWGNLAALVAALYKEDFDLLGRSLKDVIVEPVRSLLIPGFDAVKAAALEAGALGCSISGSGPSVFALCSTLNTAKAAGAAMQESFKQAGLDCNLYISRVNKRGPVVLEKR